MLQSASNYIEYLHCSNIPMLTIHIITIMIGITSIKKVKQIK